MYYIGTVDDVFGDSSFGNVWTKNDNCATPVAPLKYETQRVDKIYVFTR